MIFDINEEGCVEDNNFSRSLCRTFAANTLRAQSMGFADDGTHGKSIDF